jgi:hypothetical protein
VEWDEPRAGRGDLDHSNRLCANAASAPATLAFIVTAPARTQSVADTPDWDDGAVAGCNRIAENISDVRACLHALA